MRGVLLRFVSLIVPMAARERWREEWAAELRHGGWRMLRGVIPDAFALRRIRREQSHAHVEKAGIFHAIDQDVRYGMRTLSSSRSLTIAVIGSLAIGIGATTAAFTMVNAVLFRPFPRIRAQEELATVKIAPRQRVWFTTSWNDYEVLRQGIPAFESFSIAHQNTFAVAPGHGEEPRQVTGLVVSGNYFDVLGVRPALGRFFVADDDGTPWKQPAVVISHRFWQRRMAGDPRVLQQTVNVNGVDIPVVGVAPEGFGGPFTTGELWITFALSDLVFRDDAGRAIQARAAKPFFTNLVARLKPGSTIEQAQAQAAGLADALYKANDRGERELFVRVEPLRIADPSTYWLRAVILMIVPLTVLAIACVNAANLLLARATRQSRDWLVRLALGGTRWRLIRQMLVESLLLACGGAALGLAISYWATRYLQQFAPISDIAIDANVLAFVVAAAVATALVFGLGPALSVTRAAVNRAPEDARFLRGPFGSRTRSALVVVQAALCLGLLATGAQFTKTLNSLWNEGLPEPGHFLVVSLDVDKLRYDRSRAEAFYGDLLTRVEQLPGVQAAALSGRRASAMLSGFVDNWGVEVLIGGQPEHPRDRSLLTYATGGFFATMGLQIVEGRTFTRDEQRHSPRVVVVNEAFAKKFDGDALGRVVQLRSKIDNDFVTTEDAMIVGVVAAPGRPLFSRLPNVFYPAPLNHQPAIDLLLRVDDDADSFVAPVRTIVSGMDARLPLGQIATGEDLRRRRNAYDYAMVQTVSMLGLLALILAAAGLYGVVSYMVMLRQKEIGIRMALGAESSSVVRLVLRQTLVPIIFGCALGAAGAMAVGTLVRSHLYGVSAIDPGAFVIAAALLLLTMLVASLAPARRASQVDPVTVLRTE